MTKSLAHSIDHKFHQYQHYWKQVGTWPGGR